MGRKGDSGIVHCEPMIRCPNIVFSGIGSSRFKYISFTYKKRLRSLCACGECGPIASTSRSAFSSSSKCHDSWVSQLEFPKLLR